MFVTRKRHVRDVLSPSLLSHASHAGCVALFILFSALRRAAETISLERRNRIKKKERGRRADRLSRASRAVDLHVAGSDKSATAETAATSRETERRREKESGMEKAGCRVAVARDLSRLSRFFIRRLCLAGFVSQVIRDCLRVTVSLSLLASRGRKFSGDVPETSPNPSGKHGLMSRISDNLHL